jgi:hypothetical protein
LSGFIFKATHDGQIYKDQRGTVVVLRPGDNTLAGAAVQPKNEDYAQILFSLNETTGTSAQETIYLYTPQILVTDQIRDAITAEPLPLLSLIRKTM